MPGLRPRILVGMQRVLESSSSPHRVRAKSLPHLVFKTPHWRECVVVLSVCLVSLETCIDVFEIETIHITKLEKAFSLIIGVP